MSDFKKQENSYFFFLAAFFLAGAFLAAFLATFFLAGAFLAAFFLAGAFLAAFFLAGFFLATITSSVKNPFSKDVREYDFQNQLYRNKSTLTLYRATDFSFGFCLKSGNSTFKCKIPDKNDQLPKNCFPVKLYKDSCGNVGMGCWVKSSEVEPKQHEHEQEHQPSEETSLPVKPIKMIYPNKRDGKLFNDIPTVNYRTADNVGSIINKTCSY